MLGAAGGRQRKSKEWAKMTDEDWQRVEKDWETPEEAEEYAIKPPKQQGRVDMAQLQGLAGKGKKGPPDPKAMEALLAQSQAKAGPAMMFATVDYEGLEKKRTEELGNRWSSLLRSSGMEQSVYIIEADVVLFSTQAGLFANEIREFVLSQPECVAVEFNSQRTAGPAETAEWRARDAAKKAEKEAKNKAAEAAKAAEEKRRRKKAAKRKKKAKRAPRGAEGKVEL